jgi:enterochelin esterase-like enzyme
MGGMGAMRLGRRFLLLLAIPSLASAVALGTPLDATRCRQSASGDVEVQSFHSTTFGDQQTLRVWLPPGYADARNAQTRYPVLYLLDGQGVFAACAAAGEESRTWRVDETLARLIAAGSVEPLVVVAIDAPGGRRADEYIPYPDPIFPATANVHGKQFPEFLASEVLPLVARQFRVAADPAKTAIGGSSYGAVAALYALLLRPDCFGLGLLESTSLQVGNGQLLRDTASLVLGPTKVSIGVGAQELNAPEQTVEARGMTVESINQGFVRLSQLLAANLKATIANRPAVLVTVTPGASHSAEAWAARFEGAITFLFPPHGSS